MKSSTLLFPFIPSQTLLKKTGVHKSSVYRIVKLLAKRGYLECNSTTHQYGLGLSVVKLASNRINDLHAETSLTTQLCVLDGTDVIYLDEVNSPSARHYSHMGSRGQAHCSSLGKCLLSSLPFEELEWMYKDYTFTKYTPTTITSLSALRSELRTIRQQGYAINHGEQDEILSSIACPIFDYNGNMIAAISLGAASYLIVPETINNLLPHLQRYANMISKRMGYQIDINL